MEKNCEERAVSPMPTASPGVSGVAAAPGACKSYSPAFPSPWRKPRSRGLLTSNHPRCSLQNRNTRLARQRPQHIPSCPPLAKHSGSGEAPAPASPHAQHPRSVLGCQGRLPRHTPSRGASVGGRHSGAPSTFRFHFQLFQKEKCSRGARGSCGKGFRHSSGLRDVSLTSRRVGKLLLVPGALLV